MYLQDPTPRAAVRGGWVKSLVHTVGGAEEAWGKREFPRLSPSLLLQMQGQSLYRVPNKYCRHRMGTLPCPGLLGRLLSVVEVTDLLEPPHHMMK